MPFYIHYSSFLVFLPTRSTDTHTHKYTCKRWRDMDRHTKNLKIYWPKIIFALRSKKNLLRTRVWQRKSLMTTSYKSCSQSLVHAVSNFAIFYLVQISLSLYYLTYVCGLNGIENDGKEREIFEFACSIYFYHFEVQVQLVWMLKKPVECEILHLSAVLHNENRNYGWMELRSHTNNQQTYEGLYLRPNSFFSRLFLPSFFSLLFLLLLWVFVKCG